MWTDKFISARIHCNNETKIHYRIPCGILVNNITIS
jgi:hypothetical protein